MKSMAGFVFISVMFASLLQQVFAINNCDSLENVMNCNDCIRCGGYWCNKPNDGVHCAAQRYDNWCEDLEELPRIEETSTPGAAISPGRYAVSARVDRPSPSIRFTYEWPTATKPNVHITVLNTTQTENVQIFDSKTDDCPNGKCTTHLSVKPETNFCQANSGKYEYMHMKVKVENITEEAIVKYHVPCACECSDKVERKSARCSGNGDFSCGVCSCSKGWTGKFCENKEEPKCDNRRGDLQCTGLHNIDVECSGNGYCGPCDTCICYDDREGSQYLQPENYCADLCLIISSECEPCILDKPDGKCPDCPTLTIQSYNKTLIEEKDELNRKVWVKCKETIDDCTYSYAAMRDSQDELHLMKISNCNGITGAVAGGNVNVMLPTVLGIVAIVAAATAVAGYMMWKARHPPLAAATSHYQELEGPEGSTGINPLYKPPTSSYNNPMWKGAKV